MGIAEGFVGVGRSSENSLEVSWDFGGDHRLVYGDWKAIREFAGGILEEFAVITETFMCAGRLSGDSLDTCWRILALL